MQAGDVKTRGFTLFELLVVISAVTVIMGVALPVLSHIRHQGQAVQSTNNQKEIVTALNLFSLYNGDIFPQSVATVGYGERWNWTDPTRLTGQNSRSPGLHRALSEYLGAYIDDAEVMYCPCAPEKYKYLQQAWDAGDDWDNPDTPYTEDSVGGTYCFYWNYKGYLSDRGTVFKGPINTYQSYKYSDLLVSDYFGYGHWRSPAAFGSCENFKNADVTGETWLLSSYWSAIGTPDNVPQITLRAGYIDGHVETYLSTEVVPMKISLSSDGSKPYPDGVGSGTVFLPEDAVR